MKCTLCGTEIHENDNYCTFCGAKIELQKDKPASPKKTVSVRKASEKVETEDAVTETVPEVISNEKNDKEKKRKKSVKPGRIIFAVFLVSILINAIVFGAAYFIIDEFRADFEAFEEDFYSDYYDEYGEEFYDEFYDEFDEDYYDDFFYDGYEDYYYDEYGEYPEYDFDDPFTKDLPSMGNT